MSPANRSAGRDNSFALRIQPCLTVDQLLQLIGAALILIAFTANQLNRVSPQSYPYLVLNLAGAVLLCVLAFQGAQWGFFLMELVWTAVSAYGRSLS